MRCYRILIPVGGDPRLAETQAEYVTRLPSAAADLRVTLVHALTGSEKDVPAHMQQPDRSESVKAAKSVLENAGIEVHTQGVSSPPAEGIVLLAAEGDFNEIVIAGKKRTPTQKALLGSVTQSVVLEAEIPVTVISAYALV